MLIAGGSVAAVLAVIVAIVVIGLNSGGKSGKAGGVASTELVAKVTGVPASVSQEVGAGTVSALPQPLEGNPAPITKDGKPYVLYVGAEYCPYCAGDRWAIVEALSRFGTFSGLHTTFSAPSPEVYPNTATLSFHGASYTSDVIAFDGVEVQSNKSLGVGRGFAMLDKLTPEQEKLFATYDVPPYVQQGQEGAFPFLLIGNKYVSIGANYSPEVLKGKNQDEIAAAMSDPSSPIAKGIVGTANYITAGVCELTGNKPADVCTTPVIKDLQAQLNAQQPPKK
jgi:hypothetical protein